MCRTSNTASPCLADPCRNSCPGPNHHKHSLHPSHNKRHASPPGRHHRSLFSPCRAWSGMISGPVEPIEHKWERNAGSQVSREIKPFFHAALNRKPCTAMTVRFRNIEQNVVSSSGHRSWTTMPAYACCNTESKGEERNGRIGNVVRATNGRWLMSGVMRVMSQADHHLRLPGATVAEAGRAMAS